MFIYGSDYRYHFNKFDKQLISRLYKKVISTFGIDDEYYDKNVNILSEFHIGKLLGAYHRTDDSVHINMPIGYKNSICPRFYKEDVFHLNIRTIEPFYYKHSRPRKHTMDYHLKIKNMKIKLGLKRIEIFKGQRRPLFIFDNIID